MKPSLRDYLHNDVPCNRSNQRKTGTYQIEIGRGLLGSAGQWTAGVSSGQRGGWLSFKPKGFWLYGERAVNSLESAGFRTFPHLIGDGERFKNLKTP